MAARVNVSKSTPVQQINIKNPDVSKNKVTARSTLSAVQDFFSFNLHNDNSVDRWTLLIGAKFFEKAWNETSYSVKLASFIIGSIHIKLYIDRLDARSKIHSLEQKAKN